MRAFAKKGGPGTMESATGPTLSAAIVGGDEIMMAAIGRSLVAIGARLRNWPPVEDREGLDILVFIASQTSCGPIAQTSVGEFSDWLGGGLKEGILSLQRGVQAMRAKGNGGSVVFIAPPSVGHRAFDAFQSALRLLAKAAALELGPERIRVNVVLPGAIDAAQADRTPLGRLCTPEDVAQAVAFVASDRARFMTGAELVVDGGRRAQ